jgi:predicted DNA-binding transcriptional regulator AlpA
MPSGEKSTPALAAHARRAKHKHKPSAIPADLIARNQSYIHEAGLAPVSGRDQHDRERVHSARAPPIKQYIDKKEVLRRIGGFAYPTVWKWMRAGTFPQAFMVGGKLVWLEHEITNWIDAQPRAA